MPHKKYFRRELAKRNVAPPAIEHVNVMILIFRADMPHKKISPPRMQRSWIFFREGNS
ncbi:MAG: hypothetical protein SR1Q7_07060 [Quinella sp. 1Q7]|nr:hypothetical protein [Quinella sp. 1Q7]